MRTCMIRADLPNSCLRQHGDSHFTYDTVLGLYSPNKNITAKLIVTNVEVGDAE
jgi:hypothetical protein